MVNNISNQISFLGVKVDLMRLSKDKCKNDWCLENSVRLLRIKYDEIDKISYIIKKELLEYKK